MHNTLVTVFFHELITLDVILKSFYFYFYHVQYFTVEIWHAYSKIYDATCINFGYFVYG